MKRGKGRNGGSEEYCTVPLGDSGKAFTAPHILIILNRHFDRYPQCVSKFL
jgi:hypothetical protein